MSLSSSFPGSSSRGSSSSSSSGRGRVLALAVAGVGQGHEAQAVGPAHGREDAQRTGLCQSKSGGGEGGGVS